MKRAYVCLFLAAAGCNAGDESLDEETGTLADEVTSVADGDYVFKIVHSGKCVDIAAASKADGARVQQWTCNGTVAQVFRVTSLGNGWHSIVNPNSGKALDVRDQRVENGAQIIQWPWWGGNNQQFQFIAMNDGSVGIRARHSNRTLDVLDVRTDDGAPLQQWDWWASGNQRFRLEKVGAPSGWSLVWSDEFNGPNGAPVDGSKWSSEIGGHGWGNAELQYYTGDTKNARQENGSLVITATPDGAWQHGCWYGACKYTSARLVTKGKFEVKYGRIEARIQVPRGQGLWPAFWMLGADIGNVGWPSCGEIDVMENIGKEPSTMQGSLHGPGYSGGNPLTATYSLPGGAFADAYHVFAVEWEPGAIRFYVDGNHYQTRTPADAAGKPWAYDHPFFLLLNVAVGGNWPGSPDGSTAFPQQMKVDYVRVYKKG